jgi:hypothetical protein
MINREPTDTVILNHVLSRVEVSFQHLSTAGLKTLNQVQGDDIKTGWVNIKSFILNQ